MFLRIIRRIEARPEISPLDWLLHVGSSYFFWKCSKKQDYEINSLENFRLDSRKNTIITWMILYMMKSRILLLLHKYFTFILGALPKMFNLDFSYFQMVRAKPHQLSRLKLRLTMID
ncbi:hypothetical protein [Brucella melitensis]|uniref:hypothetical protein n=1 Tax=Brucella melitensis TaxID=29459 RepID=UPI0032C443A1